MNKTFLAGVLALLACLGLIICPGVFGQEGKKPTVNKAVQWASNDGKTQVFLADAGPKGYRLTVITAMPLRVSYHTSRNSRIPVEKVLAPLPSAIKGVTTYDIDHRFTRTTPWMRLEFNLNGKLVNELTRTFFNNIDGVVPNEQFQPGRGK